ncbi:Cytochrome P450 1A1 [Araneus ventricosus]|uniref:Cytochrome P450 1A1 n=1 Tax=Araneus ventricosus TaxID=182803 RepID=A0A4Y2JEN6_ARAVE|nr:Cytochrome P450 1A1 [Araneus ventricosus]
MLLVCVAYPEVQKKIHSEIDEVIGQERFPTRNDHLSMPFTEAAIAELMRWKTIVPLNIMRYTLGDTELKGYFIPKHTRVLSVTWAVDHDTKLWGKDVHEYKPERFLSQDGSTVVKPEYAIPFSIESDTFLENKENFTASSVKYHKCLLKVKMAARATPWWFDVQYILIYLIYFGNKKSPGPDGIQGEFLENIGPYGRERLLHIFNLSWKAGVLPKQWKTAVIIPVHKPNKDASSVGSCRPIALACIPCKLMGRIILRRITHHLMVLNLIPEEQYGFRRGHSTIDQILYFAKSVRDAHNMKPTNNTIIVFLDLTKAFDRVWKNNLLVKCYNDFNIRGRAVPWISNFLNNIFFRVK